MSSAPDEDGITGALLALLQQVAARYQRAEVGGPISYPNEYDQATQLRLACSLPGTASLVLAHKDGTGYVWLGVGGGGSEFYDKKMTPNDWVEDLTPMAEAVVDGRAAETIWRRKGKIVKRLLTLSDAEGKVVLRDGSGRGSIFQMERTEVRYLPYA